MQLDPKICYRALATRDSRFDGRFFTAVRSTGVYCRPVCPARTPLERNCLFLPCAAAAEEAGFRPCLRCRPESAPGTPAWAGTSATVSRALRLIEQGDLDRGSVEALANRLGIGARHLRRLFDTHLGASPHRIALTRRVHFARRLIDQTPLPMAEIAYAAGFSSVRRFNEAVRQTYGKPPRALRSDRPTSRHAGVELELPYRPPYPWEDVKRFLEARATPGVEWVGPDAYWRTFALDGTPGIVEVRPDEARPQLRVRIRVASPALLIRVVERVRSVFDLTADPEPIVAQLSRDPRLRHALEKVPGIRVPGAWEGFELATRAILGQQISVSAATTLAGRLAERFGEPLPPELVAGAVPPLSRLFPSPAALVGADLAGVGLPGSRARAVEALARAVAEQRLCLSPSQDVETTLRDLEALPGVGRWTAQVVAMRGLAETDAFPSTDLGLLRAFDATPSQLDEVAEAWRPWRAYAAMLLWMTARAPDAGVRDGAA